MNERDGEHPSPARALDLTFHPVVVLGAFVDDHDHFALAERQLVFVVRRTIVQSPTPSDAAHHSDRGRRRSGVHAGRVGDVERPTVAAPGSVPGPRAVARHGRMQPTLVQARIRYIAQL